MAENVSTEQAIYQLLNDVKRNYFTSNRQLNKQSKLYQTIEEVTDKGWFNDLSLEEITNYSLATATLKSATLTKSGEKKLDELKKIYSKDPDVNSKEEN
ncbi:hypothetical protein M5C72_05905 [Companilactobacillus allii]|uniref:Uncharacterized protein n=1 Tax=Companilactobacillus allii TaxID=1847728 RepID=A0A1P8Q475_9LACO|nr:hypothetical protein [Companilactobacillus allii]APX72647.1 hypothetical protein BTM29_08820 [Companilactobacillus allii]USQ69750.1 hypothetical protein M5C72_05905 [Companilactobacillus allii]